MACAPALAALRETRLTDWPRACLAPALAALTPTARAAGRGARANPPRPHRADEGTAACACTTPHRLGRSACFCPCASQLRRERTGTGCAALPFSAQSSVAPACARLPCAHGDSLCTPPVQREAEKRAAMSTKGHGSYEEVGEGEFLPAVTGSSHCVVHFYHNEFERCRRVACCFGCRACNGALNPLCPRAEYWINTWGYLPSSTSPRASSKSTRRCGAAAPAALLGRLPRASPAYGIVSSEAHRPVVTGCAVLRAQAGHPGASVRGHVPRGQGVRPHRGL